MGHFLLSLVALAIAVVVALGARELRPRRQAEPPLGAAWLALALVPAALALVVSGTLVTAAGPALGRRGDPALRDLVEAVHVHIGANARLRHRSWPCGLLVQGGARPRRAAARGASSASCSCRWPSGRCSGGKGSLGSRARPRRAGDRRLGRASSRSRPASCSVAAAAAVDSADRQASPHRAPPNPAPPGARRRVPGLERRGAGRVARGELPRAELGGAALRRCRSRGVLRLPGRAAARRLEEGLTRRIDWPETVFYHARGARSSSATRCSSLGIEPNPRWRTFCEEIVARQDLGVELVVTLGALLADVPHTRPAPVTGSASDPKLVEELGLASSRYEGPTGIVGVLHDACRRPGPAVGEPLGRRAALRLAGREPEGGARALRASGRALLGDALDLADLERASEAYELQVSEAVAQDEETEAYVQRARGAPRRARRRARRALGRLARGRAHALPQGARGARRAARRRGLRGGRVRGGLAEREGVGLRAG